MLHERPHLRPSVQSREIHSLKNLIAIKKCKKSLSVKEPSRCYLELSYLWEVRWQKHGGLNEKEKQGWAGLQVM